MNTKFEVGDKVCLNYNIDVSNWDKNFTKKLEFLYKSRDYMVVKTTSRTRIVLVGDLSNCGYVNKRFKKYEEFEIEEELFLV